VSRFVVINFGVILRKFELLLRYWGGKGRGNGAGFFIHWGGI
jgi:hypothetical protein